MGGAIGKSDLQRRGSTSDSKLEGKMVEAMQKRAKEGSSLKSFDSIILKFPKIDESLRKCKSIFEQFDEDKNGEIDQGELKRCFQRLEISIAEEDIKDLFEACDLHEQMGMKFNEFIVLLCLVYLLNEPAAKEAVGQYYCALRFVQNKFERSGFSTDQLKKFEKARMGLGNLEATFETLVNAFVFLDKNKDGYVSREEMVHAINETTSGERSSGRIAMKRFEEMDWDKNGMVSFKEFLFAFTQWVGIDEGDDDEE